MCETADPSRAGEVGQTDSPGPSHLDAASLLDAGSDTTPSHECLTASCDADCNASAGTTVVLGDTAAQDAGEAADDAALSAGSPELGAGVASDEYVADAAGIGTPATSGLDISTAAGTGEDGCMPPAAGSAGPEPTAFDAVQLLQQQARRLMQSGDSIDGAIPLLREAEAKLEALGSRTDRNELLGSLLEDLGSCHLANKDFERAEAACRRCSEHWKEARGEGSRAHARSLVLVADSLARQGTLAKYSEAMRLYQACSQMQETMVGRKHADYATTLHKQANCEWHFWKGQKQAAQKSKVRNALQVARRDQTIEHALTQMDEARKMQEECLEIRSQILGTKDPACIATMQSLASNLSWMERFAESYELY